MPRLRLSLRSLMLLMLLVALLLWGTMMGARSYDYARRARFYGAQESGWRQTAARGQIRADVSFECAEYFAQLTQKYRRAAWRPWLPVAPDPHAPGVDQWLEQERRAKVDRQNKTF